MSQPTPPSPLVSIIMGSMSDWPVMKNCAQTLEGLGIPYEKKVMSAHRTPDLIHEYMAEVEDRGLKVIIAAAGGAAHLPGVLAAYTLLPVIGCPMQAWSLDGLDSLLSIANMPGGIPVNTMAIGKAGAVNAALSAAAMLALSDDTLKDRLAAFREQQREKILQAEFPDE